MPGITSNSLTRLLAVLEMRGGDMYMRKWYDNMRLYDIDFEVSLIEEALESTDGNAMKQDTMLIDMTYSCIKDLRRKPNLQMPVAYILCYLFILDDMNGFKMFYQGLSSRRELNVVSVEECATFYRIAKLCHKDAKLQEVLSMNIPALRNVGITKKRAITRISNEKLLIYP